MIFFSLITRIVRSSFIEIQVFFWVGSSYCGLPTISMEFPFMNSVMVLTLVVDLDYFNKRWLSCILQIALLCGLELWNNASSPTYYMGGSF